MRESRALHRLYSLAWYVATPLIIAYLLYRSIRQPEYRKHWGERFGYSASTADRSGYVWIHAVSVGETRAAQPLVEALLEACPGQRILLTHTTPTGRATSEHLFGERVDRAYLAYDYPGATKRFVRRFRPVLGILMETELWPNLLARTAAEAVPMVLANARLSERSRARAERWRRFAVPALARLEAVLAQTVEDAGRFQTLGARHVSVTGNLKFDIAAPAAQLALGQLFRDRLGARPVLLWASTREGEEKLLLDALARGSLPEQTLVVVVPRHPQRFSEVAGLIRERGLSMQRRSDPGHVEPSTRVWLGDTMGEMFAYYRCADLAYVGGGILPFGTHNLIEACSVGCPVLLGPHTYNFALAAQDAIATGGARRVSDAEELISVATLILSDTGLRHTMAERAALFAERHRGATQRTVKALEPWLPRGVHAS